MQGLHLANCSNSTRTQQLHTRAVTTTCLYLQVKRQKQASLSCVYSAKEQTAKTTITMLFVTFSNRALPQVCLFFTPLSIHSCMQPPTCMLHLHPCYLQLPYLHGVSMGASGGSWLATPQDLPPVAIIVIHSFWSQ